MHIVYILKSCKDTRGHYVGITKNLERRLSEHNSDSSGYSKTYAPWEIETYITFRNKFLAEGFEKYLKSGSGNAFLRKRFIEAK